MNATTWIGSIGYLDILYDVQDKNKQFTLVYDCLAKVWLDPNKSMVPACLLPSGVVDGGAYQKRATLDWF